jgi:hypothetical protein
MLYFSIKKYVVQRFRVQRFKGLKPGTQNAEP